jgi:hypothetical protein
MMNKKRSLHKNQSGQSTVEFILTLSFALAVVFLFVSTALNYAEGFAQHYATYMAARTYMSADNNSIISSAVHPHAASESLRTFRRFRPEQFGIPSNALLPGGSAEVGLHINDYNAAGESIQSYMYVGAYSVRKRPFSFFGLIGQGQSVTYVSEAFLGKEPSRGMCYERTCQAIMLSAKGVMEECGRNNTGYDFTVFDNGC